MFGLAIYTFVVCEFAVRVLKPQPLMPRYITGTAWGVRGNIPNAKYWHSTAEVRVEYRINAQGMRADRAISLSKPVGTCRVAMFGDSFFMGYELDLRDTVASQIETMLEENGYKAEVLNFSVSGFGTAEMLRTYDAYARGFSPDAVIFQWHSSDLDDNVRAGLYKIRNDRAIATGSSYLPSVAIQDVLMKLSPYRWLSDNSHLYSWLREKVAVLVKKMLVVRSDAKAVGDERASRPRPRNGRGREAKVVPHSVVLAAELLRLANESVIADGRSFLVVDIPKSRGRTAFESDWDRLPHSSVEEVEVLHAAEVFRPFAGPDTKLYYEEGHHHLTPLAARALASAVATRLIDRGSMTGCESKLPPT